MVSVVRYARPSRLLIKRTCDCMRSTMYSPAGRVFWRPMLNSNGMFTTNVGLLADCARVATTDAARTTKVAKRLTICFFMVILLLKKRGGLKLRAPSAFIYFGRRLREVKKFDMAAPTALFSCFICLRENFRESPSTFFWKMLRWRRKEGMRAER